MAQVTLRSGELEEEYPDVADYFVHEGFDYKKTDWDHPDYSMRPSSETVLHHDIVLLKLEEHVILEIYTPVCLPRNQTGALQWSYIQMFLMP